MGAPTISREIDEESSGALESCAQCSTVILSGDRFCPCCGAPVRHTCPSCGEEMQQAIAIYCPHCGRRMPG